jgi:hypothetical protein
VYPRLVQPSAWRRVRDRLDGIEYWGCGLSDYGEWVDGSVGYAWTMRIGAFVILVLLGIANLTVRARGTRTGKKMCRESLVRPFREAKMVLLVLGFMCLTFGVFISINYIVV